MQIRGPLSALPDRRLDQAPPAADFRELEGSALLDGERLDGTMPFELMLQRYLPGARVEVEFIRDGVNQKASVVLTAKK